MADQKHLDILEEGVGAWNQWRKENPHIPPDLSNADLTFRPLDMVDFHNAILEDVDLRAAQLCRADLREANLHNAHLYRTNFCDANLTGAVLRGADLVRAKLIKATLRDTDLRWVKLGEANLRGADITGSAVYGVSAWEVTLDGAKHDNLSIARDGTPTITVDSLEVAQLVHMLLNYKTLRDVLNSVMAKGVLILGRFRDGGIEFLRSIADQLRKRDYLPMIFEFEKPDTADYTQTVITLARLSKFVIVELSGQSVPQELQATVPVFDIPFVPIAHAQYRIHSMFEDFFKYDWFLRPVVRFSNEDELLAKLDSAIITPALKKRSARQAMRIQDKADLNQPSPAEPNVEKLVEITEDTMNTYPFKSFRESVLLRARPLTQEDYNQKKGMLQTLEGSATFQPGDYLAQEVSKGEWPIAQQHFVAIYEPISQPDVKGFAVYRKRATCQAYQMQDPFTLKRANGDTLTGKRGDYLVRSGDEVQVVDFDVFERAYERTVE